MATVSNFTLSHTVLKRLQEMSYTKDIDSGKSITMCYNGSADPNNLRDDHYTHLFYHNSFEYIEFLMRQPAIREHMSHTPTKAFNDAEEHIYSDEKSSDWWWNDQVCKLNFVIATIILTSSISTAAAWSYDCPFIQQFRPDTSSKLFRRQGDMASIVESRKH